MTIASIIHGKPHRLISVAPDESLQQAAEVLTRERIGALLVLKPNGDREAGLAAEGVPYKTAPFGSLLDFSTEGVLRRMVRVHVSVRIGVRVGEIRQLSSPASSTRRRPLSRPA